MSAADTAAPVRDDAAAPAPGRPGGAAPGRAPRARSRRGTGWALVPLAVLLALLPAGLAAGLSAGQPPTYAAIADILYQGDDNASSDGIERSLATQEVLLTNRSAIEATAEAVGRAPRDLLAAVDVEVVEGSNVLRLEVEDTDRVRARAAAESLVTRYSAVVEQRAAARRDEQRAVVDEQITQLTARLVEISARIGEIAAVTPPPPALEAEQRGLEGEAQVLRQQVADLQAQALANDVDDPDAGIGRAEVLTAVTVLDEPVAPQPLRAAAGGALVGLVLAAVLLAVARQRRARHDPEAAVARP